MPRPTPHGQVPEALRLAEQYDHGDPAAHGNAWKAAVCTELRRQHARIAELESELEAVGAGGVSGPLVGIAAPPTAPATQQGVAYAALPDERAAFEARFPVPGGVHWDGTEYVVKDSHISSYRCNRFEGQWEAWKARASHGQAPATAQAAESVQKDAARYRWLRDTSNADDPSHMIALHIREEQNDASLSGIDAAIDAALAAQGGK